MAWLDPIDGEGGLLYRRSTDGGRTFEPTQILRKGASEVRLAFTGTTLHAVWSENSSEFPHPADIFYGRSTDMGDTFEPAVNLSNSANISDVAFQLAVDGNQVAVVWQASLTITFRGSTDGGATFGTVTDLSTSPTSIGGEIPKVTVNGSNIYAVWQGFASSNQSDISYRRSTDGGTTFEPIQSIQGLSSAGAEPIPQIAVSGANVSILWQDLNEIFFSRSTNGGATFEAPKNLSAADEEVADTPKVAVVGSRTYVIWIAGQHMCLLKPPRSNCGG